MKKTILIGVIILSLFLLSAAQSRGVRYISSWTPVPAGEIVYFPHALGARPLELDVWLAPFVNTSNGQCSTDFTTVTPAYESSVIEVRWVNLTDVIIQNHDTVLRCVQVIATP